MRTGRKAQAEPVMTNLNIRTEQNVKDQAEEVFHELGLNMSTAVNMFLKTVIREQGIPFGLQIGGSKGEQDDHSKKAR